MNCGSLGGVTLRVLAEGEHLILRSGLLAASRRMAGIGASWFETRFALLTMRNSHQAGAAFSAVAAEA